MRHRHQSMRAATARTHPEWVLEAVEHHRGECSVLTGTESNHDRWGRLLKGDGWGTYRESGAFNQGDPWVSWATDVWQKQNGWVKPLSLFTYDGRRAHCTTVVLRHFRHQVDVSFMVTHMPAHVAEDLRSRRETSPRERAYNDSLGTLRDMVMRQRDRHPERRIVLVGDWNIDVRTEFAQEKFDRAFRGTGLDLVPVPRDADGTHNGRLIDWAFTDLTASGDVLNPNKASDHRPIALYYALKDQP